MSEFSEVNVRQCRSCGDLFVVASFEPMRGPGKYPFGTCKPCGVHEANEGYEPPGEDDSREPELEP